MTEEQRLRQIFVDGIRNYHYSEFMGDILTMTDQQRMEVHNYIDEFLERRLNYTKMAEAWLDEAWQETTHYQKVQVLRAALPPWRSQE
jgi:hypothetical protein